MLESFINFLNYEKRYSKHTVKSYTNDISQFQSFVLNQYEIEDICLVQHTHVRSWVVDLMESGVKARSVNRKLSSLKSYFNFLKRSGKLKVNPTSKVIAPKTEQRLPSVIQEEEIRALLDEIVFEENFKGLRDRLVLETLYLTGMRKAELIELKDQDIDFNRKLIKVFGKGKKERLIPVSDTFITLIKTYINARNQHFDLNQFATFFIGNSGNKMYPKFVYNLVKRYLSLVSTSDKRSPHILRHSFATHLSNKGAKLNAIKELLGHSNLSATQIYTHNSIEQLKKVYDKAHPKGK